MKELILDFKAIWKKDRGLLLWMLALLIMSMVLFFVPIFRFNGNQPKVWARYSDIVNGYSQGANWYLTSFSFMALVFGIGHNLLSARFFTKRGKDVARLFIGITMILVVVSLCFVSSLLGEG